LPVISCHANLFFQVPKTLTLISFGVLVLEWIMKRFISDLS